MRSIFFNYILVDFTWPTQSYAFRPDHIMLKTLPKPTIKIAATHKIQMWCDVCNGV